MSFCDFNHKDSTPEEEAADLSLSSLRHELGKKQANGYESSVLIKEALRRIMTELDNHKNRCNCCKASGGDEWDDDY